MAVPIRGQSRMGPIQKGIFWPKVAILDVPYHLCLCFMGIGRTRLVYL